MEYIFAGIGLLVIIIAFFYLTFFSRKKNIKTADLKKTARANCPICGSPLFEGEHIVTKVYRPMNVPDQRCTVSGCPHCYPVCEAGVHRVCPVCGKNIPQDGYLVSRLFNKTQGKKHVMIVGCNQCLHNEAQ